MIVKYKGSLKSDEVLVDMMRTDISVAKKLGELFKVPPTLPAGILCLRFNSYKEDVWSRIWWNTNIVSFKDAIEFKYIIEKQIGELACYYKITFTVKYPNPLRGMKMYQVQVSKSTYSKKQLIKYLLDELVK